MGSSRADSPRMRQEDVLSALQAILNSLLPADRIVNGKYEPRIVSNAPPGGTSYACSRSGAVYDTFYESAFLALKFIVVCFPSQLKRHWPLFANAIKDLGSMLIGGITLWDFFCFIHEDDGPLKILLTPFIQFKMSRMICETLQETMYQFYVTHKFQNTHPSHQCKGTKLERLSEIYRKFKINGNSSAKEHLKEVTEFYNKICPSKVQNSVEKLNGQAANSSDIDLSSKQEYANKKLKRGGTFAVSAAPLRRHSGRRSAKASSFYRRRNNAAEAQESPKPEVTHTPAVKVKSASDAPITPVSVIEQQSNADTGGHIATPSTSHRHSFSYQLYDETDKGGNQRLLKKISHFGSKKQRSSTANVKGYDNYQYETSPSKRTLVKDPVSKIILPSERRPENETCSQTAMKSTYWDIVAKKRISTDSQYTIEDWRNYSETGPASTPAPVMRQIQAVNQPSVQILPSHFHPSSSTESMSNPLAPLTRFESLEEWSASIASMISSNRSLQISDSELQSLTEEAFVQSRPSSIAIDMSSYNSDNCDSFV